MSGWRAILEVARREITERWRSRSMRIAMAVLLIVAVGGAVAAARLGARTPTDDYGYVGARGAALVPALSAEARAAGHRLRVHALADRRAAVRAVDDGRVDVAVVGARLLVRLTASSDRVQVVQRAAAAQELLDRLRARGLTVAQARDAVAARALPVDVLDPEGSGAQRNRDMLNVAILVLFTALIGFGTSVATSVTEEKSSRVVELLLTTVPPRRLLAGKVVGVGLLGLAMLAVTASAALGAGALAGGAGLPSGTAGAVGLALLWFVLGYAFYSVAYAAVGATISRQEDQGAAVMPLTALMIAAYWSSIPAIASPDGTWARIAAFLPPVAPTVVPGRVVLGHMGPLELAAAVAVELAATVALMRLAAGVYERAILRIGAPLRIRSVLGGTVPARSPGRARIVEETLRWSGVAALVAGVIVGTGRPLGVILIAAGAWLVALHRRRRHTPQDPAAPSTPGRPASR